MRNFVYGTKMAMNREFHWKTASTSCFESCKSSKGQSQTGDHPPQGTRNKESTCFQSMKQIVEAPKNKPSWMPEKISKPFVNKREKSKQSNKYSLPLYALEIGVLHFLFEIHKRNFAWEVVHS